MAKDEPTKMETKAARDDDVPEGFVKLPAVEAKDGRSEQGAVVRSADARSTSAPMLDDKTYESKSGRETRFKGADMSKIHEAVIALANEDPGAARMALYGTATAGTYGRLPGDPANVVPDPNKVKKMADAELEKQDAVDDLQEEVAKATSGQPESVSVS